MNDKAKALIDLGLPNIVGGIGRPGPPTDTQINHFDLTKSSKGSESH
jgi:hypothetical protein